MWEFNDGALDFYESVGFTTYRRFMEFTNKQEIIIYIIFKFKEQS